MTTSYSVKRCHTFGFAQSLFDAAALFKFTPSDHVIYLTDDDLTSNLSPTSLSAHTSTITRLSRTHFQRVTSIDDIVISSPRAILIVDLGYIKQDTIRVPVEYDDTDIVNNTPIPSANADFRAATIALMDDDSAKDQSISLEYTNFLVDLYPHLRDWRLKSSIIELLRRNGGVNTYNLVTEYPFEYTDEDITVVVPTKAFSDIEISVDVNDKNVSTSTYRPDRDALKKAVLGKTTQLDAFSENKFVIIHTKKSAGIETKIRNQNHDVIDTLAVNGVMKAPETKVPLSMYRLMRKLEQFDQFDIVFVHTSCEVHRMNAEYPCEQIIPAYRLNEGEILAIAYRYIVMYFFGYCSIFTESMLEWRYYI